RNWRRRARALRQTEVEQYHITAIGELQVLRLDVSMDYRRLVRVKIFERRKQLITPVQHVGDGKGETLSQKLCAQIIARNKFHNQELAVGIDEMIDDLGQGRVTQPRKQARFALKRAAHLLIGEKGFLQRYSARQSLIPRFVDRAHSAARQQTNDLVASLKDSSWCEHYFSNLFGDIV